MNNFLRISICILVLFSCADCVQAHANDIDILNARLKFFYLKAGDTNVESYLLSQNSDGSWSDVDYTDESRVNWSPTKHLSRLRNMAQAFNSEGHQYHLDSELLDAISNGLDYWYATDFASDNWWHMTIGQQLQLGPLLILMQDHLSPERVKKGAATMNDPRLTGNNLTDLATQTVIRGLLRHSIDDINKGLQAIEDEIYVSVGDGIQPDQSFHQHGPLLYNYGYGSLYAEVVARWMGLTRGLSFAFSPEKITLFENHILDGTQWMLRREDMDMASRGRNTARSTWGKSTFLLEVLDTLISLDTPRRAELQNMRAHINGTKDDALVGNRHFWRSDYQTHKRENFHTSVKLCSTRTRCTEITNNENLLGYYLHLGQTAIMITGDEYRKIYPVWDWSRVPGVTSPAKNPPPPTKRHSNGTATFAGGASNGTYGVAGFGLDFDGVTAKKSWFHFDQEFVALGAGITSNSDSPIQTSVNQAWLRGDVSVQYDAAPASTVSRGRETLASPKGIFHDSVGYVFPKGGEIELQNDVQHGNWNLISLSKSDKPVSGNVFSLWLDHAFTPTDASYEYIVVPGTDRTTFAAYTDNIPVRTLTNTPEIQAVRHDNLGVTGIVFHQAGQIGIKPGTTIRVDRPCIVLLHETEANLEVTIASPEAKSLTVKFELVSASGDIRSHIFDLPGGESDAGKSVTHKFPH